MPRHSLESKYVYGALALVTALGCSASVDSQTDSLGSVPMAGSGGFATGGRATTSGGAATSGGSAGAVSGGLGGTSGGSVSQGGSAPQAGQSSASGGQLTSGGVANAGGSAGAAGNAKGGAGAGDAANGGNAGNGNAGSTAGGAASEGPPAVRFIGRMDHSDAAGPKFAWSGSGIVARFEGQQVSAKLAGGQQYTVVLDGTLKPKLVAKDGSNMIAQGLAAGPHTIELYRRTEADEGESQFLGFDFGAGKLLAPPPAKTRRLEVIGDSITCGYGDEGPNKECPFTPDTENSYISYASIAARELDADLITVAWSGKGVVCNYGDNNCADEDPMPVYYDRVLPKRANSVWDFASYQPDAVLINLGTNDFSTKVDPSQSEFEAGYEKFLKHVRSKNPNAVILCTNGPMLYGADLEKARTYIANVVKKLKDAGDSKLATFELAEQSESDGYGCDWHPSAKTHEKMAEQVVAALKSNLDW